MKRCAAILLVAMVIPGLRAQDGSPFKLVQSIPFADVEGRIDHFGVDLEGKRLFMSALGNNTVEVFDLEAGKRIHTLTGLHEPQGVSYVPESNRIFVANGDDGTVVIFDAKLFSYIREVDFSKDADNLRYDPDTRRMYVGYGEGGLGIIDVTKGARLGDIKLAGHPESFQLAKLTPRIFVNVPTVGQIAVIDRDKRAVLARWPLSGYHANFPMALDEADHRLFVTCRRPPAMLALDTESGQVVATVPCVGDADDMFYDAARKRLYISGGEGFLSVIEQVDADHYRALAKIPTAPGARTSYFVPELNRLYLAVPHRGSQRAELRVYAIAP
jgi:hypothetical protein